eukprot:g408.t1
MAVGLVSHQKQLNKSVLTECYQDFAKKLLWLKEAKLLPLDPHQAYGSMFVKGEGTFKVNVSDTNQTVIVKRKAGAVGA